MKVMHIVTKADVGGAQTYVLELATAQLGDGHEVVIVAGTLGAMADEARRRGITVMEESALRREVGGLSEFRAARRLRERITGFGPDIVHAHSSKAGVLARLAGRSARVPTVYTAHGWPFQAGAAVPQRIVSWLGETAMGHWWGHVICLTEAEATLAHRWGVVRRRRLHVVPNGLPDVPAAVRAATASSSVTIVMVARFAPPKAQRDVLQAVGLMPAGDWVVQFVGDGPEFEAVRNSPEAAAAGGRVQFLGHRDDIGEILAAADVGLLWSRYEGMPLALMEAMRAGLVCVANDLPGVHALLGADAGMILDFRPEVLADALAALIADSARRAELGAAARRRFEHEFSMDRHLTRVLAVYDAATADVGGGGNH